MMIEQVSKEDHAGTDKDVYQTSEWITERDIQKVLGGDGGPY